MATKLLMPKLGLNMVEGELVEWLKKEGDTVKKGEGLYVVETDKVTNEVEALEDGILYKILVPVGEIVPVRKIVGVLASPGEDVDLDEIISVDTQPKVSSQAEQAQKTPENKQKTTDSDRTGPVIASPLVKRMAAEKGIDLQKLTGSGPGGRITVKDLENASTDTATSEGLAEIPGKSVPLNAVRKVVAKRMAQAASGIPMVTLNSELDVSPIIMYREKRKGDEEGNTEIPGINALLVSATAATLQEFPFLNATFEENTIRLWEPINIGLAVDTPDGLMVVVCRNADKKSITEIHQELTGLVNSALNHKIKPEDLEGSTFTITNLGALGVDSFNPIINPPEAGILGIGKIRVKDSPEKKEISPKYVATFSLTFDHRAIDGAPAARFLQKLQETIYSLD